MSQRYQARGAGRNWRAQWNIGVCILELGLLATSSGCLVLEDDLVEERRPGNGINFTPRLDETTLSPANNKPVVIEGCSLRFSVGRLEEFDLLDTLSARWFVDGVMVSWQNLRPLDADNSVWTGANFLFDVTRYDRSIHTLFLVVSDGFAEGNDLMAADVDCGKTSVLWAVDTTNADCDEDETGKVWKEEMLEREE